MASTLPPSPIVTARRAGEPRASTLSRALSAAAIGLAFALWIAFGAKLLAGLSLAELPLLLAGLALGALAADGVTGLVHWACDSWGDEQTPGIGPALIWAFREHHRDPLAMLDSDWATTNREAGAATAIAFALLCTPAVGRALEGHVLLPAFLVGLALYAAPANQLHRWAHDPQRPGFVRRLQGWGLVISPARHALHHRAPHTGGYCIANGWLNPWLDRAGFWRGLERLVSRLTGAVPRGGPAPHPTRRKQTA